MGMIDTETDKQSKYKFVIKSWQQKSPCLMMMKMKIFPLPT